MLKLPPKLSNKQLGLNHAAQAFAKHKQLQTLESALSTSTLGTQTVHQPHATGGSTTSRSGSMMIHASWNSSLSRLMNLNS